MTGVQARTVRANDLEFGILEAGSGPLALCLHGFPDSAHTWRHLLPELAGAGFHAVAPFLRGFAPTGIPADGGYGIAALAADAVALHEALGGTGDAVLIGHDWGAEAAYLAAAHAPGRWRRLVTLAIPPAGGDAALLSDYDQIKRFFYMWFFRDPLNFAQGVVAHDDLAFVERLWQDWSPGFDPGEHLESVKACLRDPANLAAAIGYYRAVGAPGGGAADPARYAAYDESAGQPAPQPTLYLHGTQDGCIGAGLAGLAEGFLAPGSRKVLVDGTGHFLHLEKPREVGDHIVAWVS
ncbi:MAG: alpha/beta fold hydrolase [Streptosporangiaceae bacterium]